MRIVPVLALAVMLRLPAASWAQEADSLPNPPLAAWLQARAIDPGQVRVLDSARADGRTVTILRVPLESDGVEIWTVVRPQTDPGAFRRLGVLSDRWTDPVVEAIVDPDVYVRTHDTYGRPALRRYRLSGDDSSEGEELAIPWPRAVAVRDDSVYAAWSQGRDRQLAVAVSRADGGARSFAFHVEEPIRRIRFWHDTVAFLTSDRAIVRSADGGWGGYRPRSSADRDRPAGWLHPDLPQFRVVPGGIAELRLGDTLLIPLDYPDFDDFRRSRPDRLAGVSDGEVDVAVEPGPVTDDGRRVWFGLTFYDGEGLGGVGGLGWFDPATREAELVYPAGLADYSVSAIAMQGDRVVVALCVRPEGAIVGAGLARFDVRSGSFERMLEEGYVAGIATADGRIFAVSDRGLLELQPDGNVKSWEVFPPRHVGEPPPVATRHAVRALTPDTAGIISP